MSSTAAGLATALGGLSLLAVLVSFPMIISEVNNIYVELETEMESWRVQTDSLWTDVNKFSRVRRQAYGGYGAAAPRGGFPTGPSGPQVESIEKASLKEQFQGPGGFGDQAYPTGDANGPHHPTGSNGGAPSIPGPIGVPPSLNPGFAGDNNGPSEFLFFVAGPLYFQKAVFIV